MFLTNFDILFLRNRPKELLIFKEIFIWFIITVINYIKLPEMCMSDYSYEIKDYAYALYTCSSDTTNCMFSHTWVVHRSTHLRKPTKLFILYGTTTLMSISLLNSSICLPAAWKLYISISASSCYSTGFDEWPRITACYQFLVWESVNWN